MTGFQCVGGYLGGELPRSAIDDDNDDDDDDNDDDDDYDDDG